MKIIEDISEMQSLAGSARGAGTAITLVPTMGFLHAGHEELLRVARGKAGFLILSIFVNPAQFGPNEDYKTYPRDMDADIKVALSSGVDCVFAPRPEEMYPDGFQTYTQVERLSMGLCGEARPGHFKGVATVVLKLFNIVMPHVAVFGKKDYQQFVLIRRMVRDLNLDVEVVGVETVRESDGLAMSSRNSYLDADERKAAVCIPRALDEARSALSGEDAQAVIRMVKKNIENEPLAVIEYIKVCDKDTLQALDRIEAGAMLLLAVRIGKTRLIDNCLFTG
ncbi:MAG: pantoate--beta-alanine ligase [Deltaproteobacteria bacterium]|nr:pantoate--beta-alanine ligase [Deltaproteobacteria bacterium]